MGLSEFCTQILLQVAEQSFTFFSHSFTMQCDIFDPVPNFFKAMMWSAMLSDGESGICAFLKTLFPRLLQCGFESFSCSCRTERGAAVLQRSADRQSSPSSQRLRAQLTHSCPSLTQACSTARRSADTFSSKFSGPTESAFFCAFVPSPLPPPQAPWH